MSKYTMELRKLFEPITFNPPIYTREEVEGFFKSYNLEDYLTQDQISVINNTGLWNKDKLARKIVNHYYMREIGFETIGLFVHYAKATMEELMEEYLPLIYSSAIQYDPLVNVDYTETLEREELVDNSGNSNSSSSSNATSLGVNSDTPQGQISKEAILSGTYASSTGANENESSVSSESSNQANSNTNENYTKKVKGNSGVSATAQKMIQQYRDNIRAIDREIIEKLNVLFMGLY